MPKQTRKTWKPPEGFYIVVGNEKKFIVRGDKCQKDGGK